MASAAAKASSSDAKPVGDGDGADAGVHPVARAHANSAAATAVAVRWMPLMVHTLVIGIAPPPGYPQPRILVAMSFGAAAHVRPRLPDDADCPCGGGVFGECCAPILAGEPARTAEQLMRSRFTAFALGDTRHLTQTWHPSTAPTALDLDDGPHWERLEIVRADAGQPGDTRGIVEFRAHWREASAQRGTLHEVSRFRFAAGRWYYVDGVIEN